MPGITEWMTMLTERRRGVNFEEVGLFERTEAEERQQGDVVDSEEEHRDQAERRRQALLSVDELVAQYNLHDIRDKMRKGVLAHYLPEQFWSIEGLNDDEIAALRMEKRSAIRSSFAHNALKGTEYYFMGAIIFGQASFFALRDDNPISEPNWLSVVAKCAPSFAFIVVGCWCTWSFNTRIGRRGAIATSVVLITMGTIAQMASGLVWLFFSRVLLGIGLGMLACTSSIYGTEISTTGSRGRVIVLWQIVVLSQHLGSLMPIPIPVAFFAILRVLVACIFLAIVRYTAESPKWLVLNGQMSQAYDSLCLLRKTEVQAARDLYNIYTQIAPQQRGYKHTGLTTRLCQLVKLPKIRRAFLSAVIVSVYSVLANVRIMPIKHLIHNLWQAVDSDPVFIMGLLTVESVSAIGIALFALYGIEAYGRRGLLIRMMPISLLPLLLASLISAFTEIRILKAILHSAFQAIMSVGGFVPLTYAAEVLPLSHRDLGVPLSYSVISAIDIVTQALSFSSWGLFFLQPLFMAGLAVVLLFMIYLFMIETCNRTLEDIHMAFEASPRNFASYSLFVELPYIFNRYVLQRDVDLEPFEESSHNAGMISLGDTEGSSMPS